MLARPGGWLLRFRPGSSGSDKSARLADGGADRLGPAKEVANIGAAVGRESSHALLPAVVRKPEAIVLQ